LEETRITSERCANGVSYDSLRLAKIVAVLIIGTTFLLPFYIILYTNLWFQRYALWYFYTERNFGPITYFIYSEPLNNIPFWLPEAYIAYETYNSARKRSQSRKRFLVKISVASAFLFISYALVILFSNPHIQLLLIPLPFATVIAICFGLRFYPSPIGEPWVGVPSVTDQDAPRQ
jgi:hypothetical protein